jgi:hypothetical protein
MRRILIAIGVAVLATSAWAAPAAQPYVLKFPALDMAKVAAEDFAIAGKERPQRFAIARDFEAIPGRQGAWADFADGNSAIIQRTADGNKQYSVRLKDLIKRGDLSANVEMRPGDILIIPQSLF